MAIVAGLASRGKAARFSVYEARAWVSGSTVEKVTQHEKECKEPTTE
jgi:hypothetical protein